MVRSYTDEAVDPAILERALHNATRAPNAGFTQGWAFLVLDTPRDVRRYWAATVESIKDPDTWLRGMMRAPVLVLPCSSRQAYLSRYSEKDKDTSERIEHRWSMPYWHMDVAMASLLILQTAVDAGLGGCFFGVPGAKLEAVREEFVIPQTHQPIGALALGHPAPRAGTTGATGSPSRRRRKEIAEVVHRGTWGSGPAAARLDPSASG